MTLSVPNRNLKLISFTHIFRKDIEGILLDDLNKSGLIKDDHINVKNKYVKRYMYHHIIKGLCEHVLAVKGKERIIIIYSNLVSPTSQLAEYISHQDSLKFFTTVIKKIQNILPLKILVSDTTFNIIRADIKNKNGNSVETINAALSIIDKVNISRYTFAKARGFAKRYGLEYLSNNFFQQIKNKQLIYA